MGIANTLSLAIHERTRELGLLRAVGATRGQVFGVVCWGSVLIALLGTIEGLAPGILVGWAFVRTLTSQGLGVFAAPPAQLLIVLVVGALMGVIAALLPARRATRLNVLRAIAVEKRKHEQMRSRSPAGEAGYGAPASQPTNGSSVSRSSAAITCASWK